MNTLEFIASVIQALAWPAAAVTTAHILAKSYRNSYEDNDGQ